MGIWEVHIQPQKTHRLTTESKNTHTSIIFYAYLFFSLSFCNRIGKDCQAIGLYLYVFVWWEKSSQEVEVVVERSFLRGRHFALLCPRPAGAARWQATCQGLVKGRNARVHCKKKAGETGNHRDLNSFNLAIVISFVKLRPLEFSKKHSPSYKPPNTLRNHYCKAIDLPIIH